MALAINIPDLLYVWMAAATPDNPIFIAICVAIEQLGYGFGFTAYMLYLIYIADGEHKTAHYAIGTGFMALGMMIPGMPAGWIQEHLGYTNFFIWVCICTLPRYRRLINDPQPTGRFFRKETINLLINLTH